MNEYVFFSSMGNPKNDVAQFGLQVMLVSAVALLILISIAIFQKNTKNFKRILFLLITSVVVISSFSLVGSTIYLITKSESRGPVHWRADFEIWACGRQLELRNPDGLLSRKIGTAQFFERDDQRIYINGIIIDRQKEASLGSFFSAIGGSISNDLLSVPLNEGLFEDGVDGDEAGSYNIDHLIHTDTFGGKFLIASSGDNCLDKPAEIQVFVYRTIDTNEYAQIKLDDPAGYLISSESSAPPGDCIIIDFDASKEYTDKLCLSYGLRDKNRCLQFGSSGKSDTKCDLRQTTPDGGLD